MDEGIQNRILEQAQGRVSLNAADVNIQSFLLQALRVSSGVRFRKIPAILQAADHRIPPRFWLERKFRRRMNVPDNETALKIRVTQVMTVDRELQILLGKLPHFQQKL